MDMVYAIPNNSSIVNKSAVARKLQKEKIGSAIQESLKRKSFTFSGKSRRVLGALIAFLPKVSSLAWEQHYPFLLLAYF
jgi:hypothetical protein